MSKRVCAWREMPSRLRGSPRSCSTSRPCPRPRPAGRRRFARIRRIISFVARSVNGALAAISAASRVTAASISDRWHQPVHDAERVGFGPANQAAGEQHVLDGAGTHDIEQPAVARAREAVAERARDRDAEGRFRRRDPQVARQGDGAAAAGRHAFDLRDGRLGHALEAVQHLVEPLLVLQAVVAIVEVLELRDVGAGDERLAAGAAEDQDANLPRPDRRARTRRRAPRTSPTSSRCALRGD